MHSSSVWVIAQSKPSQILPLLMHVVKQLAVMLAVKRSAGVALEVDQGMHITFASTKAEVTRNPKMGGVPVALK